MTEVINDTDEKQKFIRGYSAMVLYRALEKKAMAAQRQGRIGFYMQSSGQEAAQIGLSMALDEDTLFYEYYRDLPMMIHRGVPLEIIFNQLFGNRDDIAKGRQMPIHLLAADYNFMSIPSPVGSNLPLAVGSAFAMKYRNKSGIVEASFGDGGSSTSDFHASLNLAADLNLPVLFFCENNGWAISLPVEKQTKVEIWKKAEAYGMLGLKADGNNIMEVYKVAQEAVQHIKSGLGPVLLEVKCYRMGAHSTSDDPKKYQTDIVAEGSEKDPIVVTEKILKEHGYLNDQMIANIRAESEKIINEKFEEQEKIPPPDRSTMFDDVYKERTWVLNEEEDEYR